MQTTYGAPSLRVTFNHAVRTSSRPFQLPMRSTFSTSAETVLIRLTRWSAAVLRATLTPPSPHPVANASTQPTKPKTDVAVIVVRQVCHGFTADECAEMR